jgi:Lrp/AsnC family leucine-responsive transcriptional regulator
MSPHPSLPALDDLDKRILEQLQRDASITNQDLAARVHASPPTCLRRVKRLLEHGIIEKQVAVVNPERVGQALTVLIEITLDEQSAEALDAFEASIQRVDEIQQCYRVSTGPDFILVALVPTMAAYHAMAHRVFTSQRNVRNVRSFFSIRRSKFETRVPLP